MPDQPSDKGLAVQPEHDPFECDNTAPHLIRNVHQLRSTCGSHIADRRTPRGLQDEVAPPSVVRDGDLVGAVWPPGSTLRRPQLGAAAQMAPAGSALDFRPAPGGAAQWCAAAGALT